MHFLLFCDIDTRYIFIYKRILSLDFIIFNQMKKLFDKIKGIFSSKGFKKIFKIFGFFFLGLFRLIIVSAIGLRIYFENHKTEIVSKINTQINNNILGEAKIGDI